MVSYSFDDNTEQFNWLPWQLGIGSMACMFCAVFLGLKFKWFRAQLNLGESKRSKAAPVEGIGFKLKTNPDDFQSYKVISEFAPVPFKPAAPNASLAATKVTRSLSHSDKHTSNNVKPSNSFSQKLDAKTSKSKSMEQLSSFTTSENGPAVKMPDNDGHTAQVTNPMFEAQNNSWRRAADVEEDNKKKKITFADEPTNLYEDEPTDADDAYFMNDSMYSSQAASIFFGSRPAVNSSSRNNYLRRDSNNESIGSDTSA